MARVNVTVKDFKRNPIRHIVIPLMIEFLSDFMMTFWGVMTEEPQRPDNMLIHEKNNTIQVPEFTEKDYMTYTFVPAFQSGISVFVCITLFSKMSYAPPQFNPAFTTVFVVVGTVPALMLIPNIIAQCLASLLAAFISQVIRGAPPPALIIPDEASSLSIFASEVIIVASLTIFGAELTQNPKMNDPLGALAIGMVVFISVLSGKWTGAVCINTSRAFGPAVLTGGKAWNRHWIFWLACAVGSTGAGIFWLMFLAPLDRSWIGRFARKDSPRRNAILMDEKQENESES